MIEQLSSQRSDLEKALYNSRTQLAAAEGAEFKLFGARKCCCGSGGRLSTG